MWSKSRSKEKKVVGQSVQICQLTLNISTLTKNINSRGNFLAFLLFGILRLSCGSLIIVLIIAILLFINHQNTNIMSAKIYLAAVLLIAATTASAQVSRNPNSRNYRVPTNEPNILQNREKIMKSETPESDDNDDIQNKDSVKIQFIGMASAASVDQLKKASGAVSIGISVAWGGHKALDQSYRLYQRNNFYMLFNPVSIVSNDSASKPKTFLFPDIGKRDFVVGYERVFPFSGRGGLDATNNIIRPLTFSSFAEFSTSHYDTGVNNFRTYNLVAGLKLTYQNSELGLPFGFQIIPNYSFIYVEPKDWNGMDMSLLGKPSSAFYSLSDKGMPPTIHTLGLNFKLSISALEFFANFKYALNRKLSDNDNIPNDFKNTAVVFGMLVNPDIWGFNVGAGPGNKRKGKGK